MLPGAKLEPFREQFTSEAHALLGVGDACVPFHAPSAECRPFRQSLVPIERRPGWVTVLPIIDPGAAETEVFGVDTNGLVPILNAIRR